MSQKRQKLSSPPRLANTHVGTSGEHTFLAVKLTSIKPCQNSPLLFVINVLTVLPDRLGRQTYNSHYWTLPANTSTRCLKVSRKESSKRHKGFFRFFFLFIIHPYYKKYRHLQNKSLLTILTLLTLLKLLTRLTFQTFQGFFRTP